MDRENSLVEEARAALEAAIIYYRGHPIGTVAARDPEVEALNYDQCFIRDFVSSGLFFLTQGKPEIVRNFLVEVLGLQSQERHLDCFKPGKGLKPASFKVVTKEDEESLIADFGEQAIARVAPVDAAFWWLFLLRAYIKATGDLSLAHQADFQQGIRLTLELCLEPRFDMSPTLLVPDGSFMIDRRMGVDGYPLEIQVLFYTALRTAQELLLPNETNQSIIKAVKIHLDYLVYHIREYYWLDLDHLNQINRYQVDQFGEAVANPFNIYPDSIPSWLDWLPDTGGYLAGNLGPGRLDFRFFTQGNLLAVVTSLIDEPRSQAIMDLIEQRWSDLVGQMPLKICFPAVEAGEWKLLTGADPKNVPWSYHNGGSWPVLLWLLAAAAQKTGRVELADKALEIAQQRLGKDQFPEYYDGKSGRLMGRQARQYQTWTIAGFLLAQELITNPNHLSLISFEDDPTLAACPI